MHFDRYGDVSRLIYANISTQNISKSSPEFSLPEIREEEDSIPVNNNDGRPALDKQNKDKNNKKKSRKKQELHSNSLKNPAKSTSRSAEPQSGPLNHQPPQEVSSSAGKEDQVENSRWKGDREREGEIISVAQGEIPGKDPVKSTNSLPQSAPVTSKEFEQIVAAVSAEYDRQEEEMKDLDRLVSDLLQEASQIPDIPYHARPDGGPFRYCPEDEIVSSRKNIHNKSFQPTYSSTPIRKAPSTRSPTSPTAPQNTGRVFELKSSWPNVTVDDDDGAEYLPKNWKSAENSNNNLNVPGRASATKAAAAGGSGDDFGYKVTVEHEPSPKNWTRIPMTTSSSNNFRNNNDTIEIPILKERTSRRDDWENVFDRGITKPEPHQHHYHQPNVDDWVQADSRVVRKPVKYSRSVSADNFGDSAQQGSEEWLARQMAKLQVKRSGSIRQANPFVGRQTSASTSPCTTPAWLVELKERNSSLKSSGSFSSSDNNNRTTAATNSSSSVVKEIPVEVISTRDTSFQQKSAPPTAAAPSPIIQHRVHQLHQSPAPEAPVNTPRFPACPPTPYMNKSAVRNRSAESRLHRTYNYSQRSAPATDDETEDEEEIAKIMFNRRHEEDLKFTVDTSCNWYKPNASREEAISALNHRSPGTFIIRNSNSFPGAYGLAIKVDEFNVRHFLIEPTRAGVRLRGSAIEPVFGSLSALVYAHTVQPLALPVKLRLHSEDNLIPTSLSQSTTSKLLNQGAACQLLFLGLNNVEMLTGTEAIQRSVSKFQGARPTLVNLRLSKSGLVLTDVMRESFFRNHHPLPSIIHAGVDPLNRSLTFHGKLLKLFGVVVTSPKHNSVLVLSEYEEGQPAVAIVSFILRVVQWRNL